MSATARAGIAAKYQKVQIATCSPAELVLMLYDGVIRFVSEADQAMEKGDKARAGERIGRALAIIEELAATLDPSHAPELYENLNGLYGFCSHTLLQANLQQDRQALADTTRVIRPLREAWAEICGKP